jgi:hypothetical protein
VADDDLIDQSEHATGEARSSDARAADLFDIRRIIGGLFVVYGLLLTILGILASQEDIDRAAGTNVNLWTGLAMLAFGILMIAWALLRPLGREMAASRGETPPAADGSGTAARRMS